MVKMILTLSLPTNRRHVSTIQQDHFLLPLSPKKRRVPKGGWLQVGTSHFDEKLYFSRTQVLNRNIFHSFKLVVN